MRGLERELSIFQYENLTVRIGQCDRVEFIEGSASAQLEVRRDFPKDVRYIYGAGILIEMKNEMRGYQEEYLEMQSESIQFKGYFIILHLQTVIQL